jgi:ubiquinone/menaquinone biosynthesis C-methylase UbiE
VEGYEASSYGDGLADVYDDWYADVSDVAATVSAIGSLVDEVGGGAVLELGVGSGRLAIPMAAAGIEAHGVDASTAMLDRLRAKPGAAEVQASTADMADLSVVGDQRFAVVLVAFNTFFNLVTEEGQRRCLAEVARVLAPGGRLVIEAFVPAATRSDSSVTARHVAVDEVVLAVSRTDVDAQTVAGQYVHISEAGIRLRPWAVRYLTPAQLDELAAAAGLALVARHAGWRGEPFGPDADLHVSTYACVREHDDGAQ